MSFDPITYAMAKKYSDSKGGYIEPGAVLTWDGNMDTATIVDGELVLVSSKVYDLSTVTRIVQSNYEGEQLEFTPEAWTILKEGEMQMISVGETPLVMAHDGFGTFVLPPIASVFVSRIEFAETIHPIDPKFLPGVCLPVVELSTTFAEMASYTAEENAKLKAAWESGTPVVIKCPIAIPNAAYNTTSFVWNRVFDTATPNMLTYVYFYGTKLLVIYSANNGETWGCMTDNAG